MAKGIQKKIRRALRRIQAEQRGYGDGKYARGLASEGYSGGYAQALRDVSLLLNGVDPNDGRNYWTDEVTHLDKKATP
jgi:ribosomal protein L32E